MPGNEVGDKVHNFFAQDSLSQGQHHSQVVDSNWSVLNNNNLWVGSQRQGSVQGYPKGYNLQQSGTERGNINDSLPVPHGLNFLQSNLRPEFANSQSQIHQSNLNGFLYGNQVYQPRHGEANFLGVDTESDRHNLTLGGSSIYESQNRSGSEVQTKTSVRSETSESPVSFDFLGSQQRMNLQKSGVLQSLPWQHSGFRDVQQLQQEVIFKKMEELQRQQQLRQLDTRPLNSTNPMSTVAKQASGRYSPALVNGVPVSGVSSYPWASELSASNTNWVQRSSPIMQGFNNGVGFSPNQVRAPHMMGLIPQQADQSLYGIPVSSSRGSQDQYPHSATDKPSIQQMPSLGNSLSSNQCTVLPDQASVQDQSFNPRQGFQGETSLGDVSGQGLNSGINMENLHQMNALQGNETLQEFQGRQELGSPSQASQEKPTIQAASSQNSVALDPTEERILFGSDDNIWDVFGRSADVNEGASSMLDGTGFLNGFPSIQSGSWSALMQSAVAETSSSNIGLREEWSSPSFQNAEVPSGNHLPLTYDNSGKQQTAMANGKLQAASTLNAGHVSLSNDANINNYHHNDLGFQQLGHKFSHGEHLNSSERSLPQSSEGRSKWLNQGLLQRSFSDGNQVYENASCPLDAEVNANIISGAWGPHQTAFSQPGNTPSGWNVNESGPPAGDVASNIHESEGSLQDFQANDQKRAIHGETDHGGSLWQANSVPNVSMELESLRSSVRSPQVNTEGFGLSNAAALRNSGITRISKETNESLPNRHHFNYWKNVDSLVKSKGSGGLAKSQHHLDKGAQVLESSLSSFNKEEVKTRETENCSRKESSDNSNHSNLSHNASAGGLRGSVVSDANVSQTMSGGKQKSSSQVGRKPSGPPKFQYHPMGNLDETAEPSYGMGQATHLHTMFQQNFQGFRSHEQGYFGQSEFSNRAPKNSSETEKGQLPSFQGQTKGFGESPSRGILSAHVPDASTPDISAGIYTTSKASQSSQNMLDLLQKVDQSTEHGIMMHFKSSEPNHSPEVPEVENSDTYLGCFQQSQSSASQGFGLQLAPPSQGQPVSKHALSSHDSGQTFNSIRTKALSQLVPTVSVQSLPPSNNTSQGDSTNNRSGAPGQSGIEGPVHKMHRNVSLVLNSDFPYSRAQIQSQDKAGDSGQGPKNQPGNVSFDRHVSNSKQTNDSSNRPHTGQSEEISASDVAGRSPYDSPTSLGYRLKQRSASRLHEKGSAAQISVNETMLVSQSSAKSGLSQQTTFPKMLSNVQINSATQQNLLAAQTHKVSSKFSQPHQLKNMESTSSALQNLNANKGRSVPSEFGATTVNSEGFVQGGEQLMKISTHCMKVSSGNTDLAQKPNEPHGKESTVMHSSDTSPAIASFTQSMEAFGRSLKPNSYFQQNYSLLNQMQTMKDAEVDPSNRGTKRLKGPDTCFASQLVATKVGQSRECNAMGDALVHSASVSSADSKMPTFSGSADNLEGINSSQLGNVPSQDMRAFSLNNSVNDSHIENMPCGRVEQSQISPQMAPSWFKQYGTFKNGQILSVCDAQKDGSVRVEQPFTLVKSSKTIHTLNSTELLNAAAGVSQVGKVWLSSTPTSAANERFSFPHSLALDVSGSSPVVLRPKKRKSATSEVHPWHEEVLQSSRAFQTISLAEVVWAKAANRLTEKVEDDTEMIEDGPTMLRNKRRFILTTQLMQQLFCPPPKAILSADASPHYESVAYFVARLTLGHACSLASCSRSDSSMSCDASNFHSDNFKMYGRADDQHVSKVMEDFVERARKLENDFLRVDKRASIVDLKVQCQDMEKFSVINRFAKFHGRGQADSAEPSSSSEAASNVQKQCPQRYVTALPMPRNLPDRVQCLSL